MKKIHLIILIAAIFSLFSCSLNINRVETDVYTITERDTTFVYEQKNAPGSRDNGIIYPSSRVINSSRTLVQRDSTVERKYPNFIRLGLFESVGTMISGSEYSAGTGLFGIFPDFESVNNRKKDQSYLFDGGIYRIGIAEYRLRWFRDAPNWTIGTSAIEYLAPDSRIEKTLISIFPLYVRKRFFLREEIPYIAITPAFGLGYYPSQYINLSASIDIGSLGGLNLRGYVGLAAGQNPKGSPQVRNSDYATEAQSSVFPYIGLGISFLDFLNIVPETYKEWKDHEHSSWNIGLIQLGFISSSSDHSIYLTEDTSDVFTLFTGFSLKIANASVALPILNNQFYVGTSLANIIALGKTEWALGILPIRLGYWQQILADELTTEPFIEVGYYPSSFIHIGNRVNLKLAEMMNVSILLGYVSGNSSNAFGEDITRELGYPVSFSKPYFGISIGIVDRIFIPEELRYNK